VAAHAGPPSLRLERGYLQRDQPSVDLNGLWGHADYRERQSDRFEKLGLQIMPCRQTPAGHVLVMGQVPRDTSVQHLVFDALASPARCSPGDVKSPLPLSVVQGTLPLGRRSRGRRVRRRANN